MVKKIVLSLIMFRALLPMNAAPIAGVQKVEVEVENPIPRRVSSGLSSRYRNSRREVGIFFDPQDVLRCAISFKAAGYFDPLDIVSAHLYFGGGGTHPLDQDLRFDAYVTSLKKIMKQHGAANKPLWDTESGLSPMGSFYIGRKSVYGIWGSKGFTKRRPVEYRVATAMAARYLLAHFWHDVRWSYYSTVNTYGNS